MNPLALHLASAVDPVVFATSIPGDYRPRPWQQEVLRSTAKEMILLCARQSGKTTTIAVLALHTALFQPGSRIVIGSPGYTQSSLLFRRAVDFYSRLGRPVASDVDNAQRLLLENGSEIRALPHSERAIRGLTAHTLIFDEASRVDDTIFKAALPMLSSTAGRLILLSTPNARHGFFHREWTRDNGFFKVYRDVHMMLRDGEISAEEVERQRQIGAVGGEDGDFYFFEREYECKFQEDEKRILTDDARRRMLAPYPTRWPLRRTHGNTADLAT